MEKIESLASAYLSQADEMADLITAEMGSPRTFSRLGQANGALSQMYLTLATAKEFGWVNEAGPVRPGSSATGAGRRRRRDRAVERAPGADHAEDDPRPDRRLHRGRQPAPGDPVGCDVAGRDAGGPGLPEGVVSVVPGGRETGETLVRHPDVDKIAFTGSSATGKRIAAACGEQLKRVSLELGGKSAAIILDDADVDHTVKHLKMAGLMNNGQACVAQTRILVSERRHDEVVDALAEMVSGLTIGDPADESTDIGPLVAKRQQERVAGYIRSGIDEGAKVVVGGADSPYDRGWYVRPTLFTDATTT